MWKTLVILFMKRITTALLIFFAFALLNNNAKAQINPSIILTIEDLPYTLDQSQQVVGLNVNSDEEIEFIVIFDSSTPLEQTEAPDVTEYIAIIQCQNESGLLIEPERVTIPVTFPPLPEIEAFSPLSGTPTQTIDLPYMSLFSLGVRIENKPPNHESTWGDVGIMAGDISTIFLKNNQTPLNSSYIDGILSGYTGVRYTKDGQTYYGWIEISIDDSAPSITIESMSFEPMPDRRSYTGTMPVVPIAFISSLIGFFAIGVGVYFRRRKKIVR